ncbi:MAG: GDP-mannose 4,6-dehydratase [Rhodospirillales bacterium]|nr:GDP-mannose 4,6-dehydratase [Rhodospirillales bacterium]MCB9994924.1 GDP-mannose 4,6-dehydratase [Rhodospirillales bacterium]
MQDMKTALITGITGQDGAILAQFLLDKGYDVHGMQLYSATPDTQRIEILQKHERFHLHYGDLTDGGNLHRLVRDIRPDEVYNLGAQSHVKVSFAVPEATAQINALGTLRLLDAVRDTDARFYQASSSEMFGSARPPQNEQTPFAPCSPYASAKLYAYWLVRNYRDSYGLHASNGILFNHESPLRGEEFVTRKVSRCVAAIAEGQKERFALGNLDALRDWGHARDYVEGMWMMLQQDKPDDYVLATGQAYSVREFVTLAFSCAGIRIVWRGAGLDEKGYDAANGRVLVTIDPQFFRPNEVNALVGDATKAQQILGWQPKTTLRMLVEDMVAADRAALREGHVPEDEGFGFSAAA